jgi:NAD(P)-dependent dehydrogenase (short-subunit alcohol dehydrogenase family)
MDPKLDDPSAHGVELGEPSSLSGRVAIVTGASSGLGQRFARVLHAAGATVVIAARRAEQLETLAEELGPRVIPARCDVTSETDCDRVVTTATQVNGRIDILVNNAGIGDPVPAEDEEIQLFRDVIDVNLVGLFIMSQRVGRIMLPQGSGSIINVASALGMVASYPIAQAGYCATKGAVINLTRELAAQWAQRGVRVNGLAPGWFRSEMTSDMFDNAKGVAFIERNTPIGRFGAADELDGALLFLAGDASTYMIGQTLAVDGGWTIR